MARVELGSKLLSFAIDAIQGQIEEYGMKAASDDISDDDYADITNDLGVYQALKTALEAARE